MFYGIHLSLLLTWSNQRTHLPLQSFKSLTALSFTGRSHCSATAVLGQANLADSREAVLPQNKRCAFRNCLVFGNETAGPIQRDLLLQRLSSATRSTEPCKVTQSLRCCCSAVAACSSTQNQTPAGGNIWCIPSSMNFPFPLGLSSKTM